LQRWRTKAHTTKTLISKARGLFSTDAAMIAPWLGEGPRALAGSTPT
jgi:hypothetical protein